MSTKIEWTQETWNPIIGCSKISEGCKNCYAERMAFRLSNIYPTSESYGEVISYSTKKWIGNTFFVKEQLNKPIKRKKPTMFFVCSMSDLFHESVPFEWILQVWDIMCSNPRHTYQLLTKRPERVIEFLKWLGNKAKNDGLDSIPTQSDNPLDYISVPDFIWIGTTVENQAMANRRIPELLKIPAKIHFMSCEPLLSNINLLESCQIKFLNWLKDNETQYGLQWVIAGPETGPKARPMQKEWIENIYKQCKSANVPFFDKKDILGLNLKEFPI